MRDQPEGIVPFCPFGFDARRRRSRLAIFIAVPEAWPLPRSWFCQRNGTARGTVTAVLWTVSGQLCGVHPYQVSRRSKLQHRGVAIAFRRLTTSVITPHFTSFFAHGHVFFKPGPRLPRYREAGIFLFGKPSFLSGLSGPTPEFYCNLYFVHGFEKLYSTTIILCLLATPENDRERKLP